MGHRGRRAARRLRARQVPRRHPAHDRHTPPRRSSRTDQGRGAHNEGATGRCGYRQSGCRPSPCFRSGLLQHVPLPTPRPYVARAATAAAGRFRGVPRWLLAQRPGGPGQVQVPQPDSHADGCGRAGIPVGEVPGQLYQPQPQARPERRRLRAFGGPRQPRHGYRLRRADPALQRGEQRGSRGALHPKGRGAAHGAAHLFTGCRRGQVRHLSGL